MISRVRQGFTLVEMLVVIVVIAILTVVTSTIYMNAQVQARDTQLRDAADKVADAIQLFISKQGHFPVGGYNSTVAISGQECVDGKNGWITSGAYKCSIEDTLVASGYLPSGFISNLPDNTIYTPTSIKHRSIMVDMYGTNAAMVYYTLEDPSVDDTNNFNTQLTKCGLNPNGTLTQRDTYGMRGGICIQY